MSVQYSPREAYVSPMSRWRQRASVCVRSTETVGAEDGLIGLPFSRALFPIVEHPAIVERGEALERRLLALRAVDYFSFTEALERDVIVPVVLDLGRDHFDLGLGPELTADAYKIVADEGSHALEALEASRLIADWGGVEMAPMTPPVLAILRQRCAEFCEADRRLVQLIFAAISETLITATLFQLPKDAEVMQFVRTKVLHHARDETLHHLVFARVLSALWHSWSVHERDRYSPLFADFLIAFVAPDLRLYRSWLVKHGFSRALSAEVIDSTYSQQVLLQLMRASAASSIETMSANGMLDHPALFDELAAAGLA